MVAVVEVAEVEVLHPRFVAHRKLPRPKNLQEVVLVRRDQVDTLQATAREEVEEVPVPPSPPTPLSLPDSVDHGPQMEPQQ